MPKNLPELMGIKWDFSELTNTAQTGDATKGTAEKGEKMFKVLIEYCTKTIKALDAAGWNFEADQK